MKYLKYFIFSFLFLLISCDPPEVFYKLDNVEILLFPENEVFILGDALEVTVNIIPDFERYDYYEFITSAFFNDNLEENADSDFLLLEEENFENNLINQYIRFDESTDLINSKIEQIYKLKPLSKGRYTLNFHIYAIQEDIKFSYGKVLKLSVL